MPERDIEKAYSTAEFVAKLHRLADTLEKGEKLEIQTTGEWVQCPSGPGSTSSTNATAMRRESSFRSDGRSNDP